MIKGVVSEKSEEEIKERGVRKAGRPFAARCMQIKWKQSVRGVYLFWCETRCEDEARGGRRRERERRNGGPTKQEDPIKPPSKPHAGGKASRHAFYYYEITVRARCRAGC